MLELLLEPIDEVRRDRLVVQGLVDALDRPRLRVFRLDRRLIALLEQTKEQAEEALELAEETKENTEEVRVLAEKAADKANRSEKDVAALQADVDDANSAVAEELRLILGQLSTMQSSLETTSDALRNEIASVEGSVAENDRAVRDEIASTARRTAVDDLHRQVRELQSQLDSLAERRGRGEVTEAPTAPTKRWVAHLDTGPRPEPDIKALPAAEDEASR